MPIAWYASKRASSAPTSRRRAARTAGPEIMSSVDIRLFLASFLRWKLLTTVSILTVVVAFFLFGLLLALDRVFNAGVKVDKADRLVVSNAITLMQPLPLAYESRIAAQ